MTRKKLEELKKRTQYYGKCEDPTPEQVKTWAQISCIEMVNSILAYSCPPWGPAQKLLKRDLNDSHSYLRDHVNELGEEQVLQIIEEQINDISYVRRGVFTDSEGCSYNTIIWKEDE